MDAGLPFINKYGPWAVVAGAAEGLGEAYTIALAKQGVHIVMADNQAESLNALAHRVERDFGVRTLTLYTDLAQPDAAKEIMHAVKQVDCRLLIYNAAFSRIKSFTSLSEKELDSFIEINTRTPLKLVHAFVRMLRENKHGGGVLLMSSFAGLIGMQLMAPYAATKAFAWNLAEALHHELIEHNIDLMACIAGATATPAYLATRPRYGLFKPAVMEPAEVAEQSLSKMGRENLFIPGFRNRMSYFMLTRILPRKTASSLANRTMKKLYGHRAEPYPH